MRESTYQHYLIGTLREMFPGCVVLKNDSSYMQGIPDLLVLFEDKWAMLEVKPSINSVEQPNQLHYVMQLNDMSYAAFIYPESEEAVLHDLQLLFSPRRKTRISKR